VEKLSVLLSREQVQGRVADLAREISRDYQGKHPLLVGVLKGCFVFLADLVRQLTIPVTIDFVRLGSYGAGTQTSGQVELLLDLTTPPQGRHLLVVEDIVDTGLSLASLLERLQQRGPASLKVCALLDKPARRQREVPLDYLGFTIPNEFVVGYGLDFAERYRHLADICILPRQAAPSSQEGGEGGPEVIHSGHP